MTFYHCTITGNEATRTGDGLTANSELINSIVAENMAAEGPDIAEAASLRGTNLIGNPDSLNDRRREFTPGLPNSRGHFVGSSTDPLDPHLAPLSSYGSASCRPPLPGSPAAENASSNATTNSYLLSTRPIDQTGLTRPFGPIPVIGAVELRPWRNYGVIDTDQDGIDDRLEPALGLTVGSDDQEHDLDGDGRSDAVELAELTNPFDRLDLLRITAINTGANFEPETNRRLTVSWKSTPGLAYRLLSSADLSSFVPIPEAPISATNSTTTNEVILPPQHRFVVIEVSP